ncbi:ATP-dependent sacrificial sulfur transferase LarE [Candidatus Electronema sp. TJ]|uniref:ATP-dependent sacrificial sulfur transferase LarE n=1 Tax=Candidatus Electronema sp. TJ TaxID=3401573 RepID=UPI003AA878DC
MRLHEKAELLRRRLREYHRVGVAFSGGADSSLLLRIAVDALGAENVLALHARSCLQSKAEQEQAVARLGFLAARLQIIALQPLTWPEFTANPPERCYLCKRRVYSRFLALLAEENIDILLDGTNFDDLQQGEAGRPGLRAVAELAVRTPLADCGLSKAEVRELSRELKLDTWNQPSGSCLATRLPAGMAITAERLEQVAAMEQTLADAGFSGCRARLLDARTVCLQLAEQDMERKSALAVLRNLRGLLNSAGVEKIFLDLNGR